MSSSYWSGMINQLQSTGVKSAGSFYNQAFVDRINDAQNMLNGANSEMTTYKGQSDKARDEYDTFSGSMKSYEDIDAGAEDKFGVNSAFETYQQSKDAIFATEAMMNALPSTINANSNVVLTQTQRERAYEAQMNTFNRYKSSQQAISDTYKEAWENAKAGKQAEVEAMTSQQYYNQDQLNKAWTTAQKNFVDAQNKVLQAKQSINDAYNDYTAWQTQQYEMELKKYQALLDSYTKKYIAELNSERSYANAQSKISNYLNSQKTYNYSGNDDFRGWLKAMGGEAEEFLNFVGNDGGIDATKALNTSLRSYTYAGAYDRVQKWLLEYNSLRAQGYVGRAV